MCRVAPCAFGSVITAVVRQQACQQPRATGHARQAGRLCGMGWVVCLVIGIGLGGMRLAWAGQRILTGEIISPAVSSEAILSKMPPDAKRIAAVLRRAVEAYEAWDRAQLNLKQLRTERDTLKTELVGVTGQLELLDREQRHPEEELQALERRRNERLQTLAGQLEAELQEQLAQAREQMTVELQRDLDRQVRVFEARQRELIGQHLDHTLRLEETESEHVVKEIQLQTSELLDRLRQIEAESQLRQTLETAVGQALARRESALQARRSKLEHQRDELVATRRHTYAETLKQRIDAELQSRLVLKEAGLRQGMSGLLHETYAEDSRLVAEAKDRLQQVTDRRVRLQDRLTVLKAQLEGLSGNVTALTRRVQDREGERQVTLTKLDETFRKGNLTSHMEALRWFGQVIHEVPPPLATELGFIKERVEVRVERERRVEEQRRVLRERQLALQISRQMEQRYLRAEQERQREQDARLRKADELLSRARQLASRKQFAQALRLVAKAEALNSPRASAIAMVREELVAAERQAWQDARLDELEGTFASAMTAYNSGNYGHAVSLFEQVIEQEAEVDFGASKSERR